MPPPAIGGAALGGAEALALIKDIGGGERPRRGEIDAAAGGTGGGGPSAALDLTPVVARGADVTATDDDATRFSVAVAPQWQLLFSALTSSRSESRCPL